MCRPAQAAARVGIGLDLGRQTRACAPRPPRRFPANYVIMLGRDYNAGGRGFVIFVTDFIGYMLGRLAKVLYLVLTYFYITSSCCHSVVLHVVALPSYFSQISRLFFF